MSGFARRALSADLRAHSRIRDTSCHVRDARFCRGMIEIELSRFAGLQRKTSRRERRVSQSALPDLRHRSTFFLATKAASRFDYVLYVCSYVEAIIRPCRVTVETPAFISFPPTFTAELIPALAT